MQFFDSLRQVAEARSAEINRLTHEFLHERGVAEELDREALIGRVRRGEVIVLDVRPVGSGNSGASIPEILITSPFDVLAG